MERGGAVLGKTTAYPTIPTFWICMSFTTTPANPANASTPLTNSRIRIVDSSQPPRNTAAAKRTEMGKKTSPARMASAYTTQGHEADAIPRRRAGLVKSEPTPSPGKGAAWRTRTPQGVHFGSLNFRGLSQSDPTDPVRLVSRFSFEDL